MSLDIDLVQTMPMNAEHGARISAALMAPDLTAAVMSGAMPDGPRPRIDSAAAAYRRGRGRPRGWPNLPPGVAAARFWPQEGRLFDLIPAGIGEDGEGPELWSDAGVLASTERGDSLAAIARRMGINERALSRFRQKHPALAAEMDAKRLEPGSTVRRWTAAQIIGAARPGDTAGALAERLGMTREALRQRRRASYWLETELARVTGWGE